MPDHDPETGAFVKDEVTKQEIIDVLQRCEQEHGKVVNATYSNYISRSQILRHFESQAHAKMEAGVHNIGAVRSESMRELLNNYFEENQFIQDMTVGLIMGDASATKNTETRNSQIQMEVVNREFAEHVREMYGPLATDVKQYEKVNETEMSEDEFELTVYKIRTRRLECFNEFRDNWYTDEGKRYPIENINMNKTILKYWYASDGDMCTDNRWNTKHYARISCHNEMDRQEEINSLFSDLPFEPNWNDGGRFTFGRYGSIKFWDYLDNKVPGYKESKWPNQSYFEEERNQSN